MSGNREEPDRVPLDRQRFQRAKILIDLAWRDLPREHGRLLELRHAPERIQQIVDSAIWPRPVIEIYAIENPEDPAVGVLVVTVPASALAPHYTRERFPARSGTTTRYLAEGEIAALYEQRRESFMASVDRPILSDHLDPADLPQRTNGIGELPLFVAPFADVRHPRGVHLGRPLAEGGRAARDTVAWLSHLTASCSTSSRSRERSASGRPASQCSNSCGTSVSSTA